MAVSRSSGKGITPKEVDAWVAMYAAGATIEDIALEVGVGLRTVGMHLKQHPDYAPRKPGGKPYSRRPDPVRHAVGARPGVVPGRIVRPSVDRMFR